MFYSAVKRSDVCYTACITGEMARDTVRGITAHWVMSRLRYVSVICMRREGLAVSYLPTQCSGAGIDLMGEQPGVTGKSRSNEDTGPPMLVE